MAKVKKYYAVKSGHKTGVFDTWAECSKQVHGYSGAMYKSFESREEAEQYLSGQDALKSKRYETEEEVYDNLKKNEVLAYVDGSNLGDGSAFSWAVILFHNNDKIKLSGRNKDDRFVKYRNVAGELFAAVNAINYAIKKGAKKITVCHDYSGVRHWALGEWKTRNDLTRYYREYFERASKDIEINFVKTDGHTGDRFNEEADELAKEALGIGTK